jgi:hypothetical protein
MAAFAKSWRREKFSLRGQLSYLAKSSRSMARVKVSV